MSNIFTQQQLSELPDLYTQENIKNPLCHFKLFTPDSNWTWYIIEFSHEDKTTCFGYVKGLESELGYFSLKEIEDVKGPLGLAVEVDSSFIPVHLSEIKGGTLS